MTSTMTPAVMYDIFYGYKRIHNVDVLKRFMHSSIAGVSSSSNTPAMSITPLEIVSVDKKEKVLLPRKASVPPVFLHSPPSKIKEKEKETQSASIPESLFWAIYSAVNGRKHVELVDSNKVQNTQTNECKRIASVFGDKKMLKTLKNCGVSLTLGDLERALSQILMCESRMQRTDILPLLVVYAGFYNTSIVMFHCNQSTYWRVHPPLSPEKEGGKNTKEKEKEEKEEKEKKEEKEEKEEGGRDTKEEEKEEKELYVYETGREYVFGSYDELPMSLHDYADRMIDITVIKSEASYKVDELLTIALKLRLISIEDKRKKSELYAMVKNYIQ